MTSHAKVTQVCVKLPIRLLAALDKRVAALGRKRGKASRASVIREALTEWLAVTLP